MQKRVATRNSPAVVYCLPLIRVKWWSQMCKIVVKKLLSGD